MKVAKVGPASPLSLEALLKLQAAGTDNDHVLCTNYSSGRPFLEVDLMVLDVTNATT